MGRVECTVQYSPFLATGQEKCILCTAGFVCDTKGLENPVKKCPKGHYCEEGSATASVCPVGRFQADEGTFL